MLTLSCLTFHLCFCYRVASLFSCVSTLEEGTTPRRRDTQGLSFHKHALSFANSIEKTAVATPGGQEEGDATGAYPINNTEVVSKLRERARDDNVTILVVDSAESLLAYINGPASIAKLVVFNLHVSLSVSC